MHRDRGARVAAAAAGVALLAVALHLPALGLWWTWDDPFQVGWAAEHGVAEILSDGAAWRRLPM